MKKITILTFAVLFLTVFNINAQDSCFIPAGKQGNMIYHVANQNGCINIKFNLMDDCYTVLYAIDSQTGAKTMLVDGDISAGSHGVMFKTGNNNHNYEFVLEIFDFSGNITHTSIITLK